MQTCIPEAASAHRNFCEARAAHKAVTAFAEQLSAYLPPAAAQAVGVAKAALTTALLDARAEWLQRDPNAWLSREQELTETPFNEARLIAERTA